MPVIHATFGTPLLATVAAVVATITAAAAVIRYAALAWDQWLYKESQP